MPIQATTGQSWTPQQLVESVIELACEGKPDQAREQLLSALDALLSTTRHLELLVAKLRREGFGKRSERIDSAQMALLFGEMLGQDAEGTVAVADPVREAAADAELDREIEEAKERRRATTERKPPVRRRDVELKVNHVEVAESERQCEDCGRPMSAIGVDIRRTLQYVPGRFEQVEDHLEKYACGGCKKGVTTATPPEPRVIERSEAGASLLAHIVVSKYADHCPLNRLAEIYSRSGVDIPSSTLADWNASVADMLTPLSDALWDRIMAAYVARTDATGIKVLDPDRSENIAKGTMWCYVGDDRDVVFRYAKSGEGEDGPWTHLKGRTGYVQADAANVFDRLFNGKVAHAVEVGCMTHARRKYFDLKDADPRTAYPLKLIARLYRIERLADERELDPPGRERLRRERSEPELDVLKRWIVRSFVGEPPKSAFARAGAYFVNHWEALTRFVEDGRLSLDNTLCEQQQRAIALGRKNYLFCGSHEAAKRAAVLYSLIRTCAMYKVPPLPYLIDVLRRLAAGWPQSRIKELLPGAWTPEPPR